MAMKIPVLSLLLRYINNVQKKDNNYDIAKALLTHYHDIPQLNIHDMADKCFVSTASLSRFVRLLGFGDYPSFKKACESSIDINVDYSCEISKAHKEDIKPIFQRYTSNIKENMDYIFNHLDYQQLDRICKMIYESHSIAFFGLEFATLLGHHFQVKMADLNKFIKIGNSYIEQKEIADCLDENSVVIIASLEGGYFYHNDDILNILKAKKVKIIALTMNNSSLIKNSVDEIIVSSLYNSETEGRISLLYMIELLLMYYVINYKNISV